jgi:hypothetical protein
MTDNRKRKSLTAHIPCSISRGATSLRVLVRRAPRSSVYLYLCVKFTRIIANIVSTGLATEEESTNKVTPRKDVKDGVIRPNGTIKLKRPFQKSINKPGNWRDGSVIDGGWPFVLYWPDRSRLFEVIVTHTRVQIR